MGGSDLSKELQAMMGYETRSIHCKERGKYLSKKRTCLTEVPADECRGPPLLKDWGDRYLIKRKKRRIEEEP